MAHRSPNCPHITFQEAAEKGRKVYAKERQHPAARKVIAEDLGYSGLNGRSLSLIGALRQYGILEGSGDTTRVSDDAVTYFVRDDGPEKTEAMKRMIYNPSLFEELKGQFGDALPSEGNLKHILVMKGFSEDSAADVIRVYKANAELVGGNTSEYTEPVEEPKPMSSAATSPVDTFVQSDAFRNFGAHSSPATSTVNTWTWTLSMPRSVRAALNIIGPVEKRDIVRLIKQLNALKEAFDEDDTEDSENE